MELTETDKPRDITFRIVYAELSASAQLDPKAPISIQITHGQVKSNVIPSNNSGLKPKWQHSSLLKYCRGKEAIISLFQKRLLSDRIDIGTCEIPITHQKRFSQFTLTNKNCEIGTILAGFVIEKAPLNEIELNKLETSYFIKEYQRKLIQLKDTQKTRRMATNGLTNTSLELTIQLLQIKAEREETLQKIQQTKNEINRISCENMTIKQQLTSFRNQIKHQSQDVPNKPYSVARKLHCYSDSEPNSVDLHTQKTELSTKSSKLQKEWAQFNREKQEFLYECSEFKRDFLNM